MRIAICIATCRRPLLLQALLDSLAGLKFVKHPEIDPVMIVVDNDADGSASEVVERVDRSLPWPLHHAVEPRRNISHARNRCVELALATKAEFVAFIDDDEVAAPDWLDELVDVQTRFTADIVNGRVVPLYEDGIDEWIIRAGIFDRGRRETGTVLDMAATDNVLVASKLLASPAGAFDPAFGLSGGGDSFFFLQARHKGARMIWADDAVVTEIVPTSRASARWILRRAFRLGNGGVFCERGVSRGIGWLPIRIGKAITRLIQGTVLLLPALVRGRAPAVLALQKIFHSLGALAAVAGVRYTEYKTIHGA